MEQKPTSTTPATSATTQEPIARPHRADALGVSASDLIDMIRSGQGADVSELVSRTLHDRRAA